MRRESKIVPGYDCRRECRHETKGEHGIHCDEWNYFVIADDGLTAISLCVFSGDFPDTVDRDLVKITLQEPRGSDLSFHVTFPTESDETLDFASKTGPCGLVTGERCKLFRSTSLGAKEFFEKHGTGSYKQPESFWQALEERFGKWDAEARMARAEAESWVSCRHCDGLGRVRKNEGESR